MSSRPFPVLPDAIRSLVTFQRLMNKFFCGPKWNFLFVYLDDFLIVSQSFQEHLEHVEQVLKQWIETVTRKMFFCSRKC